MAINAYLQTIDGKKRQEVFDMNYCLAGLWPIGDKSFPLLQYIDPYGSVVFNEKQMAEVEHKLNLLLARCSSKEQKEVLTGIRDLAKRGQESPHQFLRFRGD
jgi:hypothetical protein